MIAASVSIKSSQKLKKILEVGLCNSLFGFSAFLFVCLNVQKLWLDKHELFCVTAADHFGSGELHEQQQERSCVWIQTAEFRPGNMAHSTLHYHKVHSIELQGFFLILSKHSDDDDTGTTKFIGKQAVKMLKPTQEQPHSNNYLFLSRNSFSENTTNTPLPRDPQSSLDNTLWIYPHCNIRVGQRLR